jgi:hypothetical protein
MEHGARPAPERVALDGDAESAAWLRSGLWMMLAATGGLTALHGVHAADRARERGGDG